jgi:E3 ubiquitin-protein ligase RNF14
VPITLAHATPTYLKAFRSSALSTADLRLTHLPPLLVQVILPPTYPLLEPPRVTSLRAPIPEGSGAWLGNGVLLLAQERLGELWADEAAGGEGVGVLWSWWEWLGSGEFLTAVGLLVDDTLT